MKRFICITVLCAILTGVVIPEQTRSQVIEKKDCLFLSSLHYTTEGMRHWYSKENGGLETITGVPYDDLSCKNCHVSSCDRCHTVERNGTLTYSTAGAKKQELCLECHTRAKSMIALDQKTGDVDVHFQKGMECMDCHTGKEVHGDGTEYTSMEQNGAMDAQCENCHATVEESVPHTVHGDQVDCKACHIRRVVSCTNCHFDHFLETGEKKAVKVSDWIFLLNQKGKVTSANMQTFVAKDDQTFLMFAPHMSHSVMKEGRECNGCHGTENVKKVNEGGIVLTRMTDGQVVGTEGVIPVVNGVDYDCVYLDYSDGAWIPLENHAAPVYHFPAYGEPLSKEQLRKLTEPQE